MGWVANNVWLIPLLPLLSAGITALLPRASKRSAQALAIGAVVMAATLALTAFTWSLRHRGERPVLNFDWFRSGAGAVQLGFVLDPLAAVMLVMITVVGLLIFIFSTGYMAGDRNVTRFFCFLSLFIAAMLGLVVANSLLLLFVCWELMGLASYLLIGFWFHKPSAAAAARKAFIVTRIGDLGLFLGMLWLYRESGTLLFHDGGRGCLEGQALAALGALGPMSAATGIGLLLFSGAVGKSGQVPLHVWLPDAMEGPTPVSALIHAATMVAAGVFLVARVYPLMSGGVEGAVPAEASPVLRVVAMVGALTAVFAGLIAIGQSDIKRVLAYSTVSQLGYMFLGLGTGGVAVGMFHLITHAFFKALLFLGAGSVIHGCHEEQDMRRMGGLARWMPITFATYAVGMMSLAGVPLLFSGFWSKDEILHAAWLWQPSRWPFALGLVGVVLTGFYMTRQMAEVFFGRHRGTGLDAGVVGSGPASARTAPGSSPASMGGGAVPHESSPVMTVPLVILAVSAVLLGFVGTPAWPWFEAYLQGSTASFELDRLTHSIPLVLISSMAVAVGMGIGWWLYGRRPRSDAAAPDALEKARPRLFQALRRGFYIDELYEGTVVRMQRELAGLMAWLDRLVIGGLVAATGWLFAGLAFALRWVDELLVNAGFDAGCQTLRMGGRILSRFQSGQAQRYLGLLALGMGALVVLALWGLRTQ